MKKGVEVKTEITQVQLACAVLVSQFMSNEDAKEYLKITLVDDSTDLWWRITVEPIMPEENSD